MEAFAFGAGAGAAERIVERRRGTKRSFRMGRNPNRIRIPGA